MEHITKTLDSFKGFTIEHPRFKEAVTGILENINDNTAMDDPASAMLIGPPGTGKSRICRRIQEVLGGPFECIRDNCKIKTIPCLYCCVPYNGTVNSFLKGMLTHLDARYTARDEETMMYSIVTLLKTCETRLCIIDEIQQLAKKGADKTRERMCDCLKMLMNATGISFLSAGTPIFEGIFDANDQLAQRYPIRFRLNNFRYNLNESAHRSEWEQILAKFSSEMIKLGELADYVYLSDEYFSLATYIYTGGNMRGLRYLLYFALKRSLTRGNGTLTKSDFEKAADRVELKTNLRPDINAFRTDSEKLRKILNKENEKSKIYS